MPKFKPNKIITQAEHRALLVATMEGVLEGRVTVAQANAVSNLSQQVHTSIKNEWDMRCAYIDQYVGLDKGFITKLIEVDESE